MPFKYIKVKTKGQIEGEKLLVPKLRFKEFNNQWNKYKLEELVIFLDGQRKPIKDSDRNKFRGVYPYYGASGIIDYVRDYIFDKDTILLSEDGANILTRSTRLAFIASGKYWVNNHAHVLEPKNTNIYFLCELLESLNYEPYNTGTAQPKLNQEICKNIELNVPDIMEQSKIGNFLSLLDKKIDLQKKKIEALKIYKRGLIKKIFGDIKDNDSIRLKDLYHFAYGEGNTNPDNGGIYPVYGANGKIGGFNKYNAEYSVIIGHMGAYAGNVLFEENKHFVTYNGTIAIPKNIKILRPKFGYYMLLNTNLPRICAGSGMPFLSYEILNNIKVKLPDIKAQEKCEKVLDKTEAKIKLEKIKFKNLSQLKKSLLQQMFI